MNSLGFKVGEKLVYPNHGVVVVERIGFSLDFGSDTEYYHLRLLANNSWIMVPVSNTEQIGLRPLLSREEILNILRSVKMLELAPRVDSWNSRYQTSLKKIKSGKLEDVLEVFKVFSVIKKEGFLTFRESGLYKRVFQLLKLEVSIVLHISESEAEEMLIRSVG